MFFLLRMAFWFSLVLLMLPLNPDGETGETVGPIQALFAVRDAVADVRGMCDRKPDVCETGGAALHTIGVRAKEAARIGYELLGDDEPAATAEPDGAVKTGSVPAKAATKHPGAKDAASGN
ncbi:MAG: DUF5330 domain-containing protein [Rhizobiaceae bacterium]